MRLGQVLAFVVVGSLMTLVFSFGVNAFDEPSIPVEAETLVVTALEDNSWLNLKTEQEFRTYCQAIYSEAMVEHMVASFIYFMAENNDWHTVTKVKTLKPLKADSEAIELLAQVEYVEISFSKDNLPQDYVSGQEDFLISVIKENDTFKIDSIESVEQNSHS